MYSGITMPDTPTRKIVKWAVEISVARVPLVSIEQMRRHYYAVTAEHRPVNMILELLGDRLIMDDESITVRIVPVKRSDITLISDYLLIDHQLFIDLTTRP